MLGKGEGEDTKKPAHMSADDLNDGFVLDKDDRRLLSYTVRRLPSLFSLSGTCLGVFHRQEQRVSSAPPAALYLGVHGPRGRDWWAWQRRRPLWGFCRFYLAANKCLIICLNSVFT